MKQTATEFILDYMTKNQYFIGNNLLDIFEQAKEMEKQQIIDAVYHNCSSMTHYDLPCGEQYYQETFKKD